jgi:hypothetical protein
VFNRFQVNAVIKAEQLAEGVHFLERGKHKNHKSVAKLIAVPCYRDLLNNSDDDENTHSSHLVSSRIQWQVELRKWVSDTQAAEQDEATDEEEEPIPAAAPKVKKWTKTTLVVLFSDVVKKPVGRDLEMSMGLRNTIF